MRFRGNELAALVKLGVAMAAADGHVDDCENEAIKHELENFNLDGLETIGILASAQEMEPGEAVIILGGMDNEKKKYACGYLAAIMAADGEIDPSELKLWKLVSTFASFPTMTISEALAFWTTH